MQRAADQRQAGQQGERADEFEAPGRAEHPTNDQVAEGGAGRLGGEVQPDRGRRRPVEVVDVRGGQPLRHHPEGGQHRDEQEAAQPGIAGDQLCPRGHPDPPAGRVGRLPGPRRRPVGDEQLDQQRGTQERARVDQQGRLRAQERHQRAADREPDDLADLDRHVHQRRGQDVPVVREDVDEQRRPGGRERRLDQDDEEEQRAQDGEGQVRQRHQGDEHGTGHVADDHHEATRVAVGQPAQQRPPDQPGDVGQGVRGRGEQRRAGAVVDQDRDGDPGELVTDQGQPARRPDREELP